jgi:hypothetical protein
MNAVHPHTLFKMHFNVILPTKPCPPKPALPLNIRGYPVRPIRAVCVANHMVIRLVTLITSGEHVMKLLFM